MKRRFLLVFFALCLLFSNSVADNKSTSGRELTSSTASRTSSGAGHMHTPTNVDLLLIKCANMTGKMSSCGK